MLTKLTIKDVDGDLCRPVGFATRHAITGLIYKDTQGESFIGRFGERFIEEPIWNKAGEAEFPIGEGLGADTEV